MSEKEVQRLYELLEKLSDASRTIINEDEKAALRHAIFIIENYNQTY